MTVWLVKESDSVAIVRESDGVASEGELRCG